MDMQLIVQYNFPHNTFFCSSCKRNVILQLIFRNIFEKILDRANRNSNKTSINMRQNIGCIT